MATTEKKTDAKAAEVLTVADNMDSRRVFATVEAAQEYLAASYDRFSDFKDMTIAAVGVEEGEFDPAIYTDSMEVMVALLTRQKAGVRAVVIAPIPTLDSLLSDDAGRKWVQAIIHKELNHVAVRPLRDKDDVLEVVDQMPRTKEAFISSARESGGMLQTYNELYKSLNATMGKALPAWLRARLTKQDLKTALSSKGFADEFYPALENRTNKKGETESAFVVALNLGKVAAVKKGLDPAIFDRWLESRNTKAYTPGETDEDEADALDIESLTSELMDTDAEESKVDATDDTTDADESAEEPAGDQPQA